MTDDNKNFEVNLTDEYIPGDSFKPDSLDRLKNIPSKRGPLGTVDIYEVDEDGNKKLITNNLVLYQAREWIGSRVLNYSDTTDIPNDMYIGWIGFGDGGSTPADPYNPIPPVSTDTDLTNKVPLGTDSTSYGDRDSQTGLYYKKPIENITVQTDEYNDDRRLIYQVQMSLTITEANNYNINEIGLYLGKNKNPGYSGPFHLYAKATFPTLPKRSGNHFVFVWWLLF